jgi:GTP-dependent phosphoenolpyruvate carboxykinase
MARKGFYEELLKAQELKDLTIKMVAHANYVMNSDQVDQARKDAMTHKLLPKIIDKALPTQLTGEGGEAIKISIQVAKEIAETEELYNDPPQDTGRDS